MQQLHYGVGLGYVKEKKFKREKEKKMKETPVQKAALSLLTTQEGIQGRPKANSRYIASPPSFT